MNTIYDGTFVLGNTNELTFSAGPGIKVDQPSEGVVRIGNDETVLWDNSADKLTRDLTWPQTLSESISNFARVKFLYAGDGPYNPQWIEFDVNSNNSYALTQSYTPQNHDYMFYRNAIFSLNGTAFNNETNYTLNYYGTTAMGDHNNVGYNKVSKVIGINRISGSNA